MSTETPQRTQYPFDTSGVRFRTRAEIMTMQRQWETFETIENYNDIVYQRFSRGDRSRPYYYFVNMQEKNDYRVGQELHVLRYPDLPAGTFEPISDRPMPDVAVIAGPPSYSMGAPPRGIILSTSMTASEMMQRQSDLAIYTYVSTFNGEHKFKYNFASDEEKMGYHRAERMVRMGSV